MSLSYNVIVSRKSRRYLFSSRSLLEAWSRGLVNPSADVRTVEAVRPVLGTG